MNQLFNDAVDALHAVLDALPVDDGGTFPVPEHSLLMATATATARLDAVLGWVQATRLANEDAAEDHLFVATWFRCCEEEALRAYQEILEASQAARNGQWVLAHAQVEEAVRLLVISDSNLMLLENAARIVGDFEAWQHPQEDGE